MLLYGVAHDAPAVGEPWRRYREHANSLFGFTLVVTVIAWIGLLATGAIAAVMAWPDLVNDTMGDRALAAVIFAVTFSLIQGVALVLIYAILEDFVVPVMYLRGERVTVAWRTARRELLEPAIGAIVRFYLMKIVLAIVIGVIAMTATCLTCCVTAIPYIGTVVLLPLFVFRRCYSLAFVEQYGPSWQIFEGDPRCAWCGYDRRNLPQAEACPECGAGGGAGAV